ncbi:MAG: alpha/beta fold hydrolase [Planctomycetales bacterium]
MTVELLRVRAEDGLLLDGALHLPEKVNPPDEKKASASFPVDAFLLVHGAGSNFYAPGVLETFALQAARFGVPAARINTRGHDGVCSIPGEHGAAQGGATFETVSDCRLDLRAWLDALADRGFRRIALTGHSLGAVKCCLAEADRSHPNTACVIALSPPRFHHQTFLSHPKGQAFREDYQRAKTLVDQGRPDELFRARQPTPFLAAAGGFVAKYGPDDPYDFLKCLPLISAPKFILVAERSMNRSPAFDGLPDAIAKSAATDCQVQVAPDAEVGFSSCLEEPFARVESWLRR